MIFFVWIFPDPLFSMSGQFRVKLGHPPDALKASPQTSAADVAWASIQERSVVPFVCPCVGGVVPFAGKKSTPSWPRLPTNETQRTAPIILGTAQVDMNPRHVHQ